MQCEEARSHFTDYVNETLPDPILPEVRQHLDGCESCRDEASAMRSIWTSLGTIPNEEPNSAAMHTRFNAMMEAYRQGMDHAPQATVWNRINGWFAKWWPQEPVVQLAAGLALLLVGVAVGHESGRPPVAVAHDPVHVQVSEINQLRNELHDMRQMVALSLMQQQSASERLRGVSWSNQIEQPNSDVLNALMDTLMHDPNVNVRLAAIDALKRFGERQVVRNGVLQALSKQDAPMVQVALIDYMVDTHEKESVPALKELAQNNSVNETVRQHAEWGLEQLK